MSHLSTNYGDQFNAKYILYFNMRRNKPNIQTIACKLTSHFQSINGSESKKK